MTLLIAALICVSGCRNYRTLEELEESAARAEALATDPEFASPSDPLVASFERVRRLYVAHDAVPLAGEERVALERGQDHDALIPLRQGTCYTFIAHGDADLDVDLVLQDPGAQTVAFDRAPDPFPVIASWCAPSTGTYRLQLHAARGSGEVLFGAFALPVVTAEAARRLEALRAQHFPDAGAAGPVLSERLMVGEETSVPLATLPGACYAIVAVGDALVTDLDLVLTDDRGAILTRDLSTDATPVVRYCAEAGGNVRLFLRPYAGAGVVWWQVFQVPQGA